MEDFGKILKILESGTSQEKIKQLEELQNEKKYEIIQRIIQRLDDPDIKVRGEAFCSLILNKNKILDILIKNLKNKSRNIRGFASLVLANRNDRDGIPSIIGLTEDQSSMVRGCAIGALGHLKVLEAKKEFNEGLSDSNIEVRKSALKAIIDIGESISEEKIKEISKDKDGVLEKLLITVKKGGPGGI